MIAENIFSPILFKFPVEQKLKLINIQQDNIKPHARDTDGVLITEGSKDEWIIQYKLQPPNYQGLNILRFVFVLIPFRSFIIKCH